MKTRTSYEWDIEVLDLTTDPNQEEADIIDHQHSERCPTRILKANERLVLVRDEIAEDGDVVDRTWAYVTATGLPEFFKNAGGGNGERVPKRFVDEYIMKRVTRLDYENENGLAHWWGRDGMWHVARRCDDPSPEGLRTGGFRFCERYHTREAAIKALETRMPV